MTHCFDEGQLRALLDDALSEAERQAAEGHLSDCETCAASLEVLRGLSSQVSALMSRYAPIPDELSAFARVRAMARTDRVASYFAKRRTPGPRPVAGEYLGRNKSISRGWPDRLGFALSGVSVAAIILIVLGLSGFFNSGTGGVPISPPSPTPLVASAPRVGYLAPDFTLTDVRTNQPVNLSSLRGRPVWINFWGTWCPPCRVEMPEIQKLYDKYAGQVEVLGVSMGPRDYPEQVISFINGYGYTWTFVHDPDMSVMNSYIVQGIPASYFIDKDGVIRSITVGGTPASTLERELLKAITQGPVPVATIIVEEPETSPTEGQVSQVESPRMPLEEFKQLYDNPATRPLILDTRSRKAYDEGHIAGAVSFPEADVDARVSELPKDRLIVAYCQ